MATGRDAADVAITTSFGADHLTRFYVESNEIDEQGNRVPLPTFGPEGGVAVNLPAELTPPTQTNSQSSPTQTQSATL